MECQNDMILVDDPVASAGYVWQASCRRCLYRSNSNESLPNIMIWKWSFASATDILCDDGWLRGRHKAPDGAITFAGAGFFEEQ